VSLFGLCQDGYIVPVEFVSFFVCVNGDEGVLVVSVGGELMFVYLCC